MYITILILLAALLINCKKTVQEKNISIELFTQNCGVDVKYIKDSLENVLKGYPSGYQLSLSGKKIGIVIDEERGEVLSSVNTIEFNDIDSLKMNRFFRDHGVVLIGDGIIDFKRGELFCVQRIDDNRIYTCYLRPSYKGKGYILDMTYDCIKGLE